MKINLSPTVSAPPFVVVKDKDALVINHVRYDLSSIGEGDTLPDTAISSMWFPGSITRLGGRLELTLLFPIPSNYSQAQAFPSPLVDVPDGLVVFPRPDQADYTPPQPDPTVIVTDGVIDWSMLITKAMKDAEIAASQLVAAKAELSAKNAAALTQISRIQDRIDTIGFGIDIGEATEDDEAEQAALLITLKSWKTYKFALGKVTVQPTWYQAPVWPVEPPIPEIIAAPMLAAAESI